MSYALAFAFDRGVSVRWRDLDGRLHVDAANLRKSCVSRAARDMALTQIGPINCCAIPGELARSVSSFNNLPVLSKHVPVNAVSPGKQWVVGTTGSDARFDEPYLTNSLVVWDQDAIDGIEDGTAKEISCGYRFEFDPTPGRWQGQTFDGVMRDISGSHVALVESGRVGPHCVVGDAAPAWMVQQERWLQEFRRRYIA